jgi:fibro-slime domain-containing protein
MSMSRSKHVAAGFLVLAAGVASMAPASRTSDPHANLPATLSLTGVVRDFRERSVTGGHPDFERQPSAGFGHYVNMVNDSLGSEGKPVMRGTSGGNKLNSNFRDSAGRNRINNKEYIASRSGDVNGSVANANGGALTTAANFDQWFRDVPGVNLSRQQTLTLVRQPNSNVYSFNDRTDAGFADRGGFFPINGELFGNSAGNDRNFHFTFELETQFIYERDKGQVFTFTGDDDVWVFIDDKLVVDIGGVHSAISQSIELDRLSWLQNGREYQLKFFFAERHRTQSNFRIDTTMVLRSIEPPATSALFD